jgi:hypothetical protein
MPWLPQHRGPALHEGMSGLPAHCMPRRRAKVELRGCLKIPSFEFRDTTIDHDVALATAPLSPYPTMIALYPCTPVGASGSQPASPREESSDAVLTSACVLSLSL